MQAVRHANGKDWWLIAPEYVSNCYYIIQITKDGIQSPIKQCIGKVWNEKDWSGQAVFSPDGKKYARFNGFNGLNIFDFDRCAGHLSNPLLIPFDSIDLGGVAISSNSRFLYAATSWEVYQFDLEAEDIANSKTLVGEYDGFVNPFPANYYLAQLAPDEKIYLTGTSSLKNLHVINNPNEKGVACEFVPHGIDLPVNNVFSIPNFPHYRLGASEEVCDFSVGTYEIDKEENSIHIFPNPATHYITINLSKKLGKEIIISDLLGKEIIRQPVTQKETTIQLSHIFANGIYNCTIYFKDGRSHTEKLIINN